MAKCKTCDTIESMEAAIAKVRKQLGRYEIAENPATLRPFEGENFIEARLRTVEADLTIGLEGLRVDLSSYQDALACCERYRANMPLSDLVERRSGWRPSYMMFSDEP